MLLSDHVNIVLRVCKGSREIKFLFLMFLGLQNEPSKINGNLQIRQPQLLVTHHSFIYINSSKPIFKNADQQLTLMP